MSWTVKRLNQLIKTENLDLSENSVKQLLDRVTKDKANDIVAIRLAKYYHKKDNNESGGSVTSTVPQFSITGHMIGRVPRVLSGKLYEAENVYIMLTKETDYPQTQDRDGVVAPEGKLPYVSIISAQSWLKKQSLNALLPEDTLGKEIVFKGSWGSYQGKVQFSIWGYDDSNIKEYDSIAGLPINNAAKDPFYILDDESLKYQPLLF